MKDGKFSERANHSERPLHPTNQQLRRMNTHLSTDATKSASHKALAHVNFRVVGAINVSLECIRTRHSDSGFRDDLEAVDHVATPKSSQMA
jgi:hypothetical protein